MTDATAPGSKCTVLLVDDDDVAAEAVLRSFKKHGVRCHMITAADGLEALEVLNNQHPSKRVADPCIVLLDLNMPRLDGFGFLEAVRADRRLQNMIVFVLTTSSRDEDRTRAYDEHIAGYMVKSAVGPQFSLLAEFLERYTRSVVMP